MNYRHTVTLRLALLACISACTLPSCDARETTPATSSTQQKIAALQGLRDSGVLSEDEYQQKVTALQNPASATSSSFFPAASSHTSFAGNLKKLGEPTVAHTLNDQTWGLPWGTIKLPPGWGFNGCVVHGNNCIVSGDNPMWIAESPDKTLGIAVLPVLKAGYVSEPQTLGQMRQAGCPILHSPRAADFLIQVVLPHLHKNFHVVGTAPEPMFNQLASMLQQQNQQLAGMLVNNQMMQNRDTVDTARVVITFDEGGATRVEIASTEFSCHETHMAGIGRMPGSQMLDCTSFQTLIMHAPDDGTPITSLATMDLSKSTEKPFFTISPNPAWQQRYQQAMQQQNQQIQANMQAQSAQQFSGPANNSQTEFEKQQAIRKGVRDYSAQIHNNVYQNQQNANSQVSGAYAAHVGDYNVYTNQSTGQQYQMSNQFNNSYVNQNGTVGLQTNSANSPGVDWTQLTPKY